MATITDLELNTTGVNSRTIINTNFDNLNNDKAELSGATYTGLIQFSGTDHLGIRLVNLTTAQRDAIAASNGHSIYNSTNNQVEFYQNGSWVNLSGVADATATVKGIVEIATQAEIDAGTATGGTSASIAITPDQLALSIYGTRLPSAAQKTLLDGITSTAAEINKLDGYTGDVNDLNEMEAFFGSTDISGAEAETLTDGSQADNLHYHFGIPGGSNGYFTYQLSQVAGNWSVADATVSIATPAYWNIESSADTWYAVSSLPGITTKTVSEFNDGKNLQTSFRARVTNGTTGDRRIGFGDAAAFPLVYNSSVNDFVGFAYDGGTLYAVTANAGVGATATDISAGITATNWNLFRVEFDAASAARFYVNGTLKATIATNLPDGANTVVWGAGGTTNTEDWQLSSIIISQEL